jgi:hypothetical protein
VVAVPLLLPLLLPVDLPVVEAPEESPEFEAPDEAAALLSEPVVDASLLLVDEGSSEESLLDEFAVDFALEASDDLGAGVVDSAAAKKLAGDHVRLQRFPATHPSCPVVRRQSR